MRPPTDGPDWLEVFTAAERPDLWEATRDGFLGIWPPDNLHGDHTESYFGALIPDHAHLQVLLVDRRTGRAIARGRSIPFRWDGTLADLPAGLDDVGRRALDQPCGPTTLAALATEVDHEYRKLGLIERLIRSMIAVAGAAGFRSMAAVVRPSWKMFYPLTPIQRYATWRDEDGLPLDPSMRVHTQAGGRLLRTEPQSLRITAPVAEWERWTDIPFPEDGRYVFADGLDLLDIDRSADVGRYWDPHVWYLHDIRG